MKALEGLKQHKKFRRKLGSPPKILNTPSPFSKLSEIFNQFFL